MSDTMLLGVLRMPLGLAMATPTAQIQYHQRGVQAADEIEKLTRQRDEARAEVENLYDQVHRWVDDRAKAQARADRLREQNYELQRERDEARAEVERLRKGLRQGFPIRYETAAGCLCPAGANASCQNSFCPRRNPPGVTCGGGRS